MFFTRTPWYDVEDDVTLCAVACLDVTVDDSALVDLGQWLRDEHHPLVSRRHCHHLLVVRLTGVVHLTDVVVHAASGCFDLKQVRLAGASDMYEYMYVVYLWNI